MKMLSPHNQAKENRVLFFALLALTCSIVLMYLYLLKFAILDGQYMPAWSDEYEYQKNMESFLINGNLITSLALEENYARFFGSSGHGFAYTLTNGLFAKILGATDRTIIYINFILISLSALAVGLTSFLKARERLFIIVSLLLYPVVIFYSLSYMMEMYQLFFGVVLSLIIAGLYRRSLDDKPYQPLLLLFYVVIIIATTYRQTWALWGVAAIPLGKDRKQVAWRSVCSVLLLAYGYLFSSYFLAKYPYDPRVFIFSALKSGNITEGLTLMYDNLLNNIKLFFSVNMSMVKYMNFDYNFAIKIALLVLSLYFALQGVVKKNRYYLVAASVVWANIIAVFLLFTTDGSAVQRHLAPVYYFMLIYLVSLGDKTNRKLSAALFLLQIIILYPAVFGSINEIKAKKLLSGFRAANSTGIASMERMISENIHGNTLTTIYLPNQIPIDDSLILYALPTRGVNGAQLRYTMNPIGQNMKLWNKVPVSYLLAPSSIIVNDEHVEFVAQSGSISLYRILKYPDGSVIRHLSIDKKYMPG